MPHTVYILQSLKDGRLYKGSTQDVQRRMAQHNAKAVRSTKAYAPWRLVLTKTFPDKTSALRFERFLKTRSGYRWIQQQIPLLDSPRRPTP